MGLLNVADFRRNLKEKVSSFTGSGVGLSLKGPMGMGVDLGVGSSLGANSDLNLESGAKAGSYEGAVSNTDVDSDSIVGLSLKGPIGMGIELKIGGKLGSIIDSNSSMGSELVTHPDLDFELDTDSVLDKDSV